MMRKYMGIPEPMAISTRQEARAISNQPAVVLNSVETLNMTKELDDISLRLLKALRIKSWQ